MDNQAEWDRSVSKAQMEELERNGQAEMERLSLSAEGKLEATTLDCDMLLTWP